MSENLSLEPYNNAWPEMFKKEANFLMESLPQDLLLEFHHIGSTAIPDMPAKPVIDVGVMITSFSEAKTKIVPIMEKAGYEYIWREDRDPAFMMFIKRDGDTRTHHVHMAVEDHNFWDRLYFREFLKQDKEEAQNYAELKASLIKEYPNDREAYTEGKADYVKRVTSVAKDSIDDF